MARNSLWIIQPVHQPNTAGAGTSGDYVIFQAKDYTRALFDLTGQRTSLGLLTTAFTEGVDFPLQPHRWENEDRVIQRAFASQQKVKAAAASLSTVGLGVAYALAFSDPPTPDVQMDIYPFPFSLLAKRRGEEAFGVIQATQEARGSWIHSIPATAYRVPVCEVLDEIQFHMLEEANFGQSFGSGLWTVTEVVNYINQRTARFLLETGILQKRLTQAHVADEEIVDLPTDLIDLRRVAWTRGSTTTELPRVDADQVDSWIPSWESTGSADPSVYTQGPEPSLQIRLARMPTNAGTLDIIYVAHVGTITNDCSIFPLPDEWVPYIKYGVMADMWSKEGEANDPERAGYCEQRWTEGIALAKLFLGVNN